MRRSTAALMAAVSGSLVLAAVPSHQASGPAAVVVTSASYTLPVPDQLEVLELKSHPALNVRLPETARRAAPRSSRARRAHAVSTPVCTIAAIRRSVSSGEAFIIERESGWSTSDYNPVRTSTGHAFGLGQLTDENRERYAVRLGADSYSRDACVQLAMMRMYIKERYGSTDVAVAFWHRHHWY